MKLILYKKPPSPGLVPKVGVGQNDGGTKEKMTSAAFIYF